MYKASSLCLRVIAENTPVRVNIAPIPAEIYATHFNAFIDPDLDCLFKRVEMGGVEPPTL